MKVIKQEEKPEQEKTQLKKNSNLCRKLRQKKKQIMESEEEIKAEVKKICSELTISLMEYEKTLVNGFCNRTLLQVYEKIDEYCAMSDVEQSYYQEEIQQVLKKRYELSTKDPFVVLEDLLRIKAIDQFYDEKTDKKVIGGKENYERIITKLEDQIQKLTLKETKLERKLQKYSEKQHKSEQKNFNLKVERLQAENKVLIEQISNCSEKIMQLLSQNSLLKDHSHTQLHLSTDRKFLQDDNFLLNEYKIKISQLSADAQKLKIDLVEQEKKNLENCEQITKLIKDSHNKQAQVEELKEYNERLYNDYEINVKKKIENQEKITQIQKQKEQLSQKYHNLSEQNEQYQQIIKLKQQREKQKEESMLALEEKLSVQTSEYKKQVESHKQIIIKQEKNLEIKSKQNIQIKRKNKIYDQELTNYKKQLFKAEESLKRIEQQYKALIQENQKILKERDGIIKKQVSKIKKELKKQHQAEKENMINQFSNKFGDVMNKIIKFKKEEDQLKQKFEKKRKIMQSRFDLFKSKVEYQIKEMAEKMKIKGNIQIIQKYVESQSTIALKNSQINQLKEQISKKKQKIEKEQIIPTDFSAVQSEINSFEKNVIKEKYQLELQIRDENYKLEKEEWEKYLEENSHIIKAQIQQLDNLKKQKKEIEQKIKTDSSEEDMNKLKSKLRKHEQKNSQAQQQMNGVKLMLSKQQQQNQQLKEQLKVKKQLISGLRKQIKDKQEEKIKLNLISDGMIRDIQKLKRQQQDAIKKTAMYSEMKEKVRNYEEISEQLEKTKRLFDEKQKQSRAELSKKQTQIKQYKIAEQILMKKQKQMENQEQDIKDHKIKIKKLKQQIDRKDKLIEHMKLKHEKQCIENQDSNQIYAQEKEKNRKMIYGLEKKYDNCRMDLLNKQSQCEMLKTTIKQIYEKIWQRFNIMQQNQEERQKVSPYQFRTQSSPNTQLNKKYEEGLSILQLTYEDLDLKCEDILSSRSPDPYKSPSKFEPELIDEKISLKDIEPKQIISQFEKLIYR